MLILIEEDQAKTKTCPFITSFSHSKRVMEKDIHKYGISDSNSNNILCLGSGCMAWCYLNSESNVGKCTRMAHE